MDKLKRNTLDNPPAFRKLLGPSFILLGLGLGSGELILWPFLTSNYGLGIIWGAVIGITLQFFINMEISRYSLVNGESIFVGYARKLKYLPVWFLLSTFLPWIWPGIIASSAKVIVTVLNTGTVAQVATIELIAIGLLLSLGPSLYKTVEKFQKILIGFGVPIIALFALYLASSTDYLSLAKGIVGVGNNYMFLPEGISIATFLAAFAYSGAGGNLNLAQSFYIKEKEYGMGKYSGKISSLITNNSREVSITGSTYEDTSENRSKMKDWWTKTNIEHLVVFWFTGAITILLLALLAYSTTYGLSSNMTGINFVISEAAVIGSKTFEFFGYLFLILVGLMLFGTQLTVFDATSRILTENTLILRRKLKTLNTSKVYYLFLWFQIISGITVFMLGFTEPLQLLIISAVLNALAMFVHTSLTLWVNTTLLNKSIKPSMFRISMLLLAIFFYGGFSLYILLNYLNIV